MEWRPVRGFEGEYLVSDSGDIKSVTRNVPNKANRIYLFPSIKPDQEYTLDEIIGGAE